MTVFEPPSKTVAAQERCLPAAFLSSALRTPRSEFAKGGRRRRMPLQCNDVILFKYLRNQPKEIVQSGKLDRYLDAMEQVGDYSSSEPRDIYAFYVQRGMTERTRKFRDVEKKRVSYDLDYFFNQVDANPGLYKRE